MDSPTPARSWRCRASRRDIEVDRERRVAYLSMLDETGGNGMVMLLDLNLPGRAPRADEP
ncbi:MAG TPA: hypothetical protein VM146_18690 [Steroidobacteraceae bacterium]|nr:hypothetical protein [Steroidobacteraceae bacterium]